MARLSVQYNRIIVHDVDLGARFADLHADIVVDKTCRVQVLAENICGSTVTWIHYGRMSLKP